jgi:hypothetical protein
LWHVSDRLWRFKLRHWLIGTLPRLSTRREQRNNEIHKSLRFERLRDMGSRSSLGGRRLVERVEGADKQDYWNGSEICAIPYVRTDFESVSTGHVNIGKDDIRPDLVELADGSFAIAHGNDLEIDVGKRLGHQALDCGAVIREEYGSFHCSPCSTDSPPVFD